MCCGSAHAAIGISCSAVKHPDRWHTAIHEAGHAAIGRVLGMLCGSASIKPEIDGAGNVIAGYSITVGPESIFEAWLDEGVCPLSHCFASVLRCRIKTVQAGAEAEAEILGECRRSDSDDRYQAQRMLEKLVREGGGHDIGRMRAQSRNLVRRHRATIERVASALMQHESLAKKQIDALVWPPDTMVDYLTYEQFGRFHITATRDMIDMMVQQGSFPRAQLFNGRKVWRVRDVKPFANRSLAPANPAPG